ncbi:phosphotransferase family protein [Novosphingobium colocasiae]|uniref:Aminoglycoside phosphotransferase n=1 Tax=Novosphingobium colocasiae TaxID=1256513 RepID=A0A918P8M2_9SPHN|nr:phosphotransferase family protein [Novosphingobium colocasiae]GGY90730.1 aminoglycoside phosphotransferase [Novosphingobium colocasiae]
MTGATPQDMARALTHVLGTQWGRDVAISALRRLTGGTSHDSWAFDADDGAVVHPLILRREFAGAALDVSLAAECDLLHALHAQGLPVPRTIAQGAAGSPVGTAYAICERLSGGDLRKRLAGPEPDRPALGLALVAAQARLHDCEVARLPARFLSEHGYRSPAQQVDTWSAIALDGIGAGDALLVAAIDRLRRACPAPGEPRLVHGDFKTNNVVCDDDGRLAVIDWELAHLGDPLEDLAWTMLWTTPFDLVGGIYPADAYLAAYEAVAGRSVDRGRLAFWNLFALVKLAAIFVRSASLAGEGGAARLRPTHAMLLRAMPWIDAQLARQIAALAPVAAEAVR